MNTTTFYDLRNLAASYVRKKYGQRRVKVEYNGETYEVTAPKHWSDRAVQITVDKYFDKKFFERPEPNIYRLIEEVIEGIIYGKNNTEFDPNFEWYSSDNKEVLETFDLILKEHFRNLYPEDHNWFITGLYDILAGQYAAFNSPVWFNFRSYRKDKVGSACFIFKIEDDLQDILEKIKLMGEVFSYGSGVGVNWSYLREENAPLSNGGMASGPISFMEMADATANVVKSGGKTRRAALLFSLDADHPDIEKFITVKGKEEEKAHALIEYDAMYDNEKGWAEGALDSEAYRTVKFQNANFSIAVTDEFMKAVEENRDWNLISRYDGSVVKTVKARELLKMAAEQAWKTGDPGLLFIDRMNEAVPEGLREYIQIRSTNPCGEFSFADSSACNLASINLLPQYKGKPLTQKEFKFIVFVMIMAMDLIVDATNYVYPEMTEISRTYRPLGLGYTNLGALILYHGYRYGDSNSIELTEHWTSLLTQYSHEISAHLKNFFGHNMPVDIGRRNIFTTLLAPTGTISFIMDAETTGIEPYFSLVTYKKLVGGGVMELIPPVAKKIAEEHGIDVHNITEETLRTYPQFATAMFGLLPEDHLNIQAAAQKHLDMAISKTINLPNDYTPEQIEEIYIKAWKAGVKGITVYRDGSKIFVPLATSKEQAEQGFNVIAKKNQQVVYYKEKLPAERSAIIHKFQIGEHEGYITFGFYPDGRIGEIFIEMSKEGSTLSGMADAFATAISIGLQHGVPIQEFIEKFKGWKFEPSGWIVSSGDIDLPFHQADSIIDYVFRYIEYRLNSGDWKPNVSLEGEDMKPGDFADEVIEEPDEPKTVLIEYNETKDMVCPRCGAKGYMRKLGGSKDCYYCTLCGESTGCS